MPHLDSPGVLQVEMRYEVDAQAVYNVFHVIKPAATAWALDDIDDVINVFHNTYWTANVKPLMCPDFALLEIVATDLTSLDGIRVIHEVSPIEFGTLEGVTDSNNVALAIKLGIGKRGRGVSGRIFWGPPPDSKVAGDMVDADYAASAVAAINALRDSLQALSVNGALAVLSRFSGGLPRSTGLGRAVTSVGVTDLFVDSMKLRLPRHKKHRRTRLVP